MGNSNCDLEPQKRSVLKKILEREYASEVLSCAELIVDEVPNALKTATLEGKSYFDVYPNIKAFEILLCCLGEMEYEKNDYQKIFNENPVDVTKKVHDLLDIKYLEYYEFSCRTKNNNCCITFKKKEKCKSG